MAVNFLKINDRDYTTGPRISEDKDRINIKTNKKTTKRNWCIPSKPTRKKKIFKKPEKKGTSYTTL